MCLNCGCKIVDDDMGNADNITLTTLAKAAIASNMDGKSTLQETKEALDMITPEQLDKKIEDVKA